MKSSYDQLSPLEQQLADSRARKLIEQIVKLDNAVTSSNMPKLARWLKGSEKKASHKVIPFKPVIVEGLLLLVLLVTPAQAGWFGPSNHWECILDEMPGVKNDQAAIEVRRKCLKEFPSTAQVKKKSAVIGVKTAGECVIEYSKEVTSPRGAKYIRGACYMLYPRK